MVYAGCRDIRRYYAIYNAGNRGFTKSGFVDELNFPRGGADFSNVTVLFEPTDSASLQSKHGTKDFLVLKLLEDVRWLERHTRACAHTHTRASREGIL